MKIEDYWEDVMIYFLAYTTIESPEKVIEETVITSMIADIKLEEIKEILKKQNGILVDRIILFELWEDGLLLKT